MRHGYRAAVAALAALTLGLPAVAAQAAPAPAPSSAPASSPRADAPTDAPTDAAGAQQARTAADHRVAALTARIGAESRHLSALSTAASVAEQRYGAQQVVQTGARVAAAVAQVHVGVARAQYAAARSSLVAIAVASYQSDGGQDSLGSSSVVSLLTVDDPSDLLSAATERRLLGDHQADVVTQLTTAVREVQNAQRQQESALAEVTRQTARLAAIRQQAEAALTESRAAVVTLKADLVTAKATQKQAVAALSTFLGGWASADPARALELNTQYRSIAKTVGSTPPAPRSARWTAGMGQTAADRALQFLGTPYAWAGGTGSGPTQGVCAGDGAKNDCHVVGFDCSGLALYGWAPYLSMAHSAATQYRSGTLHPAIGALLPGDLLFWSSDATAAGIHHVAIYVGNGNVIQAPQSGDIVRITPLGHVSSGFFGATRPLS